MQVENQSSDKSAPSFVKPRSALMTSGVHSPATHRTITGTAAASNGGSSKTNLRNLKCDAEFEESSTSTSSDSDCESTSTSTSTSTSASASASAEAEACCRLEISATHHQHHLETTGDGDGDAPGDGGVVNRSAETEQEEAEDGTGTKIQPLHPNKADEGGSSTGIEGDAGGGRGAGGDGPDRGCNRCDILLFDLDGTLYGGDVSTALNAYTQDRILDYLVRTTRNCPKFEAITTREEAYAAWRPLILRYNQTVRGLLMDGYDVDVEECNRAIRGGSERFLRRDERLRGVLTSLPQRKMIFTNAPESTARTYLRAIGIGDCFERIFGMDFMGTGCCKPEVEAFEKVLNCIGVDPTDRSAVGRICFFEDNRRNLLRGKEMGMRTVLVARRSRDDPPVGPAEDSKRLDDDDAAELASSPYSATEGSLLASREKRDGEMEEGVDDRGRWGGDLNEPFDFVIEDIGRDLGVSMPCLWS